jgi:hypothetical protein
MFGAHAFLRRVQVAVLVLLSPLGSTIVQAREGSGIPSLYPDRAPFLAAIEKERPRQKPDVRLTGIAVPHHLLAADLIARGFWAASAGSYDRIILVSPDHFNRSRRPLATTRQDIETPFGIVRNDDAATSRLLSNGALFDESDLFKQEHGIAAVLPFVRYFFPDARIRSSHPTAPPARTGTRPAQCSKRSSSPARWWSSRPTIRTT